MNPVLAPRNPRCLVCRTVADPAHVALYIWDEDGARIPAGTRRAAEYLAGIAPTASKKAMIARIETHRTHVERFLARPSQAIAPMQLMPGGKREVVVEAKGKLSIESDLGGGVRPPPPPQRFIPPERTGPSRWVDVQQNAMEVGNDALAILNHRLRNEHMEDSDIISVAKLGASAAAARGALEAKGRRLNQVDELIRMAAGGRPPPKQVGPP